MKHPSLPRTSHITYGWNRERWAADKRIHLQVQNNTPIPSPGQLTKENFKHPSEVWFISLMAISPPIE